MKRLRFLLFLAWRDFVSVYKGSVLGWFWGVVEPAAYALIAFFFFEFVIGGSASRGQPYAKYVLPVLLAWMTVTTALQSSVTTISQYQALLSEQFDLRLLAAVKLLPIVCIHVAILSVLMGVFWISSSAGSLSISLFVYALVCLVAILTGVFWIVMSLAPFVKDIRNIVGVGLQFGFWVAPIFWERSQFPGLLSWIMVMNPFHYPLQTYRVAFVGVVDAQAFLFESVYFWVVTLSILYFGSRIFARSKAHFGDVLT